MANRPSIPVEMKRSVRRRCGYGCIMCGVPIYEYHHINGFKSEVGHIESEITILCDGCHRKTTNGLIPLTEIIHANINPFNRQPLAEHNHPEKIWYSRDLVCETRLGSNRVWIGFQPHGRCEILALDGHVVCGLEVEEDHWLLNLEVRDPCQCVLQIHRNELVYRLTNVDDVEYQGGTFTLRFGGEVYFKMKLHPPVCEIIEATFYWNGILVAIHDGSLMLLNGKGKVLTRCEASHSGIAVCVGRNPGGGGAAFFLTAPTRLFWRSGHTEPLEVPEDKVPLL